MAVVVISWGLNFAIVKSAFTDLPPLAFNAMRFSLAASLLVIVLRVLEGPRRVPRADFRGLLLLGLIGHAGYQGLFITGLSRTSAAHSSLILATTPLFVGALAVAMRLERSSPRMWAGLVIAFVGLSILVEGRAGAAAIAGLPTLTGDLLTLAATLCWAGYTVLARPFLTRVSPLRLTTVTLVLGLPIIVASGVPDLVRLNWAAVRPHAWAALAYSAVFAIVISYVLWSVSVQAVGSSRTAAVSNLTPVVALISAWALLGETLGWAQVGGAAVVLLGVWLARVERRPPSPRMAADVSVAGTAEDCRPARGC
jgi:drug/metabolite transporter (DMT)-like permease